NGQLQATLVAERRPMALACDIHPWMKGYMMVFNHPFFAVTKEDGLFEITGVPAGAQNLVVWQEKVGYVTKGLARGQEVTVHAGPVDAHRPWRGRDVLCRSGVAGSWLSRWPAFRAELPESEAQGTRPAPVFPHFFPWHPLCLGTSARPERLTTRMVGR